jgi:hypothetical protein
MNPSTRRACSILAAPALCLALAASGRADDDHSGHAGKYRFTKVADSFEDGFDPFSFECLSINNHGDIAFRTARVPAGVGSLIQGIYRADDGEGRSRRRRLTTIAEFGGGFDFLGQNPSINDAGEVAFAVREFSFETFIETQSILRGDGRSLRTIATTVKDFSRFGFEPTVNEGGVVAFKAKTNDIDNFDFETALVSGRRRRDLSTHYLSSTSEFSEFGTLSRPAINNRGDIAFEESVDGESLPGVFVTRGDGFKTIAAPDPDVIVDRPTLNDAGTVAFHRFFNFEPGEELVKGNGGPLTVIADTNGPFASFGFFFGFQAPALNKHGDVAFYADLDSDDSPLPAGIFVGPDVVKDRVVGTGDRLDGLRVRSLRFCEEGLSDQGELAFLATFDDPRVPDGVRIGVYRATPRSSRR